MYVRQQHWWDETGWQKEERHWGWAFVGSCEVIHVGVSGFLGWGYSFMWLNQMLWGEGEDFALCGKWWLAWRSRGAPVLFVKTRPSHSILPLPQEPGLQADLWPADWIGWLGWQQVLGLSLVSSAGDCLVKPQPQLVVQLAFAIVRAYQTFNSFPGVRIRQDQAC